VAVRAARLARKALILVLSIAREAALAVATGGLWPILVTLPRALAPHFSSALGTSVAVSVSVLTAVAAAVVVGRWAAGRDRFVGW
jgi:hypothetical protein